MKKNIRKILAVCAVSAVSLAAFIALQYPSAKTGVIRTSDGRFVKTVFTATIPGFHFTRCSAGSFDSREAALSADNSLMKFSLLPNRDIELIDYTAGAGPETGAAEGKSDTWNIKLRDYIGQYQLNAAGNRGFLFIYARGNSVYGTVRFPSWGKGVQEPLKKLTISNGNISFVRSAKTKEELAKLGIQTPFEQIYSGTYFHSGKTINGTYTVNGARKQWDAVKK